MSFIIQLRQPEYTGENRCTPCTVVNIIIAAIGGAIVTINSAVLGVFIFGLSLVVIYLRGYLIPGTPTFTRRYFPNRVLRWFNKEPTTMSTDGVGESIRVDPEQALLDARAVMPCKNGTDLCLRSDFQASWCERQLTLQDQSLDGENILGALNAAPEEVSIEEYGDALIASTDDGVIGQWPSSAAAVADIAAAEELADRYSHWERLNIAERTHVLTSLRIFIKECPECNGPVRVEQEVVDSCCMSHDVVVSACQNCDAQLFEIEWDDEFVTVIDAPDGRSEAGQPNRVRT